MRWMVSVLGLVFLATSLEAAPMRCGNDLVRTGDHITEVEAKCGEPIRATRVENEYGATAGWRKVYDGAHGSRNHEVTFVGDRVTRIELLR